MLLFIFGSYFLFAQTEVKGLVFDEYLEPFPGATVKTSEGKTTSSNFDGEFVVRVKKFPVTITVSLIGYQTETIQVSSADDDLNVILKETLGLDQVVVSASRTPERVIESPVTIERIDGKSIKRTPSPNFYQSLGNLKGIDVLDNNLLTKAIGSNRGFISTENNRFVQLVDGVDTAVPVFDYALGNLSGLVDLDVKNVEILPGAASALYGANAFNGILLMTSKNPFDDSGVSVALQSGITTQEDRGAYAYYDVSTRMAYKFSDHFAAKASIKYIQGEDWVANDRSDINGQGFSHLDNPNYNGVNVYGDEVSLNLVDLALLATPFAADPTSPLFGLNPLGLISGINGVERQRVSRTGFAERDMIDYDVNSLLFDGSLHFRPWGEQGAEIIFGSKFTIGDNITQSSNRYDQSNSSMQQFRFEVRDKNYFVRGYYNENDAGKTIDTNLAGVFVGSAWKDNRVYFQEYAGAYFSSLASGLTSDQAHLTARGFVNRDFPSVTSSTYQNALKLAKETTLADGGALLSENSGYYHVDANYNFADFIDFADIQVGGSFRSFALDSNGQVYTDDDGVLRYRQYGLYTQVQKKFIDDRLKLTGTVRFDKSRNFEGNFSPRATISYAAGEKRDHNFRIGFQTGFRNPTSQNQYLGLTLGNIVLLGSVEENLTREVVTRQFISDPTQSVTIFGTSAFNNSYTASSVDAFQTDFRSNAVSGNLGVVNSLLLQVSDFELVKPETVQSFELGYRGALDVAGKLFEFDIVGYYNLHNDFITPTDVVVPFYGDVNNPTSNAALAIANNDFQRYSITTNIDSELQVFGFSAGFSTKLFGNFDLSTSYAFSDFTIEETDIDFKPFFNAPKHAVKAQFGNDRLFKNFGFSTNVRWQDEFLYQTRFVDRVLDSRFVLDAQLNYTIPSLKSFIKVGATNLTGEEYISATSAGTIGSQYYISWIINN
ncbi:carboxypeptidase-like regulatory domain-containing protein [Tenacibaculum sp. ZS6-P6]|uniref:carboxypeptidase-like regulatory domain-containing protein n=1 Tax=Tenacibaculum sp. ZS6-P6 TaxID=3447503 RepID=UPI003F9A7B75